MIVILSDFFKSPGRGSPAPALPFLPDAKAPGVVPHPLPPSISSFK